MNVTTQTKVSTLQSAMPAAIRNASKTYGTLARAHERLNVKRKIYDVMHEFGESVLVKELCDHLIMFGYKGQAVEIALRAMFNEGMMTRSKLRPYAYRLVKNCRAPVDSPEFPRGMRKMFSDIDKQGEIDVNCKDALPTMAKLNSAIEDLTKGDDKYQGIHYGCLASDLETINSHFSKISNQCKQTSGLDEEIAGEYHAMSENVDEILNQMRDLEYQIRRISQLAKRIRSNPL